MLGSSRRCVGSLFARRPERLVHREDETGNTLQGERGTTTEGGDAPVSERAWFLGNQYFVGVEIDDPHDRYARLTVSGSFTSLSRAAELSETSMASMTSLGPGWPSR